MTKQDKRLPAFEDNTPMWFGKHKGEPLQDVPAKYLQWLFGELEKDGYGKVVTEEQLNKMPISFKDKYKLYNYIFNSYDAIQMEIGEKE